MSGAPWVTNDPWEHVRLLSDPARNAALLGFLRVHAPGRRVLEIGCGTGVLAAAAARMGAREVIAVEATSLAGVARQLMADNGLERVTVLEGRFEELAPRPVNLAFSELLNADPFAEGVVEISRVARTWLGPDGRLAPSILRVWAASVGRTGPEIERQHASLELDDIAARVGLELGAVRDAMREAGAYRSLTSGDVPSGRPVCVQELTLGVDPTSASFRFRLPVRSPRAASVIVWFEAVLDEHHTVHNRPGTENHWGQQLHTFPEPLPDGAVLEARLEDGELFLTRAE